MSKEEKNTYTIHGEQGIGEVKIADEVVASIAAFAALEVKGVSSLGGNPTKDIIGKLGGKSVSTRGVKVDVLDGIVTLSLAINLLYGYSLVKVTTKVQDRIKSAIENMTGLTVANVNVRVLGVDVPEEV